MLMLLPPSEGKTRPARGKALALESLSFPSLTESRRTVLDALTTLCSTDPVGARGVLGTSNAQDELIARNARLALEPSATADRIYTGVLYESLGLRTLDAGARRRAISQVLVMSALFGVVRITDRVPAYRLSAGTNLPIPGSPTNVLAVNKLWQASLKPVLHELIGDRLVIDLRSGPYASMWRPSKDQAHQVVNVRVLAEYADGRRVTVSHFNKSTKGTLARALLRQSARMRSASELADICDQLGFRVELTESVGLGHFSSLDVITAM